MQHQLQEPVEAVEELDVSHQFQALQVQVDLEVEALEQKVVMVVPEQLILEVVAVVLEENQV